MSAAITKSGETPLATFFPMASIPVKLSAAEASVANPPAALTNPARSLAPTSKNSRMLFRLCGLLS